MQINNTTPNLIKETEKIPEFPPFLSYNSISPAIPGDNINNNSAEGGGYAPIVRQLTHNTIEKSLPTQRERQKIVEKNYPLVIPGIGERCKQSETVLGAYRCNDCHKVELKVSHCEGWGCRVCGSRKVRRQSKEIVKRLYAFKHELGTSANPRHFVISNNKWADMDLSQISKSMNNLFARHLKGVSGVYVIHPFRVRGWDNVKAAGSKARFYSDANIKRRLREYRGDKKIEVDEGHTAEENLSTNGFWDMIKDDVLRLGSWRKYCYVSPHVHVIAWGYLPNSEEFYKQTGGEKNGYIYKMIDTKGIGRSFDFVQNSNTFDFSSEVLRTLNYLGSHAAIRDDTSLIEVEGQAKRKHANRLFRPFGLCSTKSFSLELYEGHKVILNNNSDECSLNGHSVIIPIKCPDCAGADLVETNRFNKSHYYEADNKNPFDDDYNPLNCEGGIIFELIKPLKYFEWNWYRYKFKETYLGDIKRFSSKLPKPKPYNLPANFDKMGKLEKSVYLNISEYERANINNSSEGVMIE